MDMLNDAEGFLRLNARLIDRHRFALHFRGAGPAPVLAALRPYENPDGGYGHALEPDLRGEASQPVPAQHALEILHETGADDDPAVARIAAHLETITAPDGGVPFVLPAGPEAPRAPWWRTTDTEPPGSINPTASLAGLLYRAGLPENPWLKNAAEFCWRYLEAPGAEPGPYDVLAILTFLDHTPERDRAEAAFTRHRATLAAAATLDPHAEGAVHSPLDLAPTPHGYGRRLFTDETVQAHLDALAAARRPDGGWTVGFLIWTPVTEPEWRGHITVERLLTLRAYGMIGT
ncbi:hypothetical protein ACRB68_02860 [Actinomadura sp. RB68]|uniref:Prenyltransferase n=2 Tax=Actinomadura macrotermitis TaxID=2585200 RepID=A0A7K0BME7_9ACTN|nr:hypothetical protein [Actinomadura macrotermitis]